MKLQPMELQPCDIEVGCILRPRRELDLLCPGKRPRHKLVNVTKPGIPCQWNTIFDGKRKVNSMLRCPNGCKLTPNGQEHPIVVIKITGNEISYVQVCILGDPHADFQLIL